MKIIKSFILRYFADHQNYCAFYIMNICQILVLKLKSTFSRKYKKYFCN